jgi:hypothetical protein
MRNTALLFAALLVSGCSTLQGRPSPVLNMDKLQKTTQDLYSPDTAMKTYATLSVDRKRTYRNEVLFSYLAAIDAKYRNFVTGLTSQNKSGNALASLFGLYTSALASVSSGHWATGFATSSTFFQGAQGAMSKDLFYEQALPSLINLMEAERSRVRADILRKLTNDRNAKNAITYTLAEAFMDVGRYEDAASVEKAVAVLAQQAAQTLTTAENAERDEEKKRNALINTEENANIDNPVTPEVTPVSEQTATSSPETQ